jgi:hypothetical protein
LECLGAGYFNLGARFVPGLALATKSGEKRRETTKGNENNDKSARSFGGEALREFRFCDTQRVRSRERGATVSRSYRAKLAFLANSFGGEALRKVFHKSASG